MSRDPRYDILFEPVKIGPHTAKNRFFQVPHCNGMGTTYPMSMGAMRRTKAEGGWAVVNTEETEIHPNGDMSPLNEGRLWDRTDIARYRPMLDGVHEFGALAGIQLNHPGHRDPGLYSREAPLAVGHIPVSTDNYPQQGRAMDLSDIRDYRSWHRNAAILAAEAGFDIIYIYCREGANLNGQFLSRFLNTRTDEYGGSLENRLRVTREILEDTKDAVGDRCAVALRFTIDDLRDDNGVQDKAECEDAIGMIADIPDLWDVNVRTWSRDSVTSRFGPEAHQEEHVSFVKALVPTPVVGVGRFTSPDTMVRQVKRGILDFIGAARPSIADPFLPTKIERGEIDAIRECIGCNICVTADTTMVPLRCTQNPTMGEEHRRGWHPEIVPPKSDHKSVLVVGSGPSGLEAAATFVRRGYEVTLAEARDVLGGRVTRESQLPGLSAWARVREHRLYHIQSAVNCQTFLQSRLEPDHVFEMGCEHVVVATGARWRHDGTGRSHARAIPVSEDMHVLSPDDIMMGAQVTGPVLIFDDDCYYMGSVLAEKLVADGHKVALATPTPNVSAWTEHTLEQGLIEARLRDLSVRIFEKHTLFGAGSGIAHLEHVGGGPANDVACNTIVMVTARDPIDDLYRTLMARQNEWADNGVASVARIGDASAPGTIAAAIYTGHLHAREFEIPKADRLYRREFF